MIETRRAYERDKVHHIEAKSSSRDSDKLKAGSRREVQEVEQTKEEKAEQPQSKGPNQTVKQDKSQLSTKQVGTVMTRTHPSLRMPIFPKIQLSEAIILLLPAQSPAGRCPHSR